jgi:hypothetical protein
MGTFRFHNLTLAITVLSPQADKINKSLHHIVPGLFDLNRKEDSIISAYKIDFICTELNSSDIETKLTDIKHEANDFFYFVIDIENDITSLNLAIKIREWCIRRTILSNNRVNKNDSPVIAFRCQNPDIAHLSASIVVQAEKHGNSWYNDYLIIPFGGIHESYSFDSLKREPFEKLAQCIHFQYSSLPLECSEQSKNDSLKNYYSRCYNRDSSFAVALSLPYRLFQVSAPDGKHIYPSGWDIINDEAYTHDKSLADMANTFDEQLNNETKKELAIYEHARWNRYMRARGWLPSTPDQTIKYIKNGNPKQQLYIGKLHSCICPWDDLSVLQKKLASEFELGDNKFKRFKSENIFTEIDISNVISTADILKTRWLSSKEEDKNNIR